MVPSVDEFEELRPHKRPLQSPTNNHPSRPLLESLGPPVYENGHLASQAAENAPVAIPTATRLRRHNDQASDQRFNHSLNDALGPAPAPSDSITKKPEAGPIIVYDDGDSSTTSYYPNWETPFEGKNHYTGTTMELLRNTVLLQPHQCFLPLDMDNRKSPIDLGTREFGTLIYNIDEKHWTSMFVMVESGMWTVKFLDPIPSLRPTTCAYAQKMFNSLFLDWALEIGHGTPFFSWIEEVIYFPIPFFDRSSLTHCRHHSAKMTLTVAGHYVSTSFVECLAGGLLHRSIQSSYGLIKKKLSNGG